MNDIFIKALYNRICVGQMDIEQVPEPYRGAIEQMVSFESEKDKI